MNLIKIIEYIMPDKIHANLKFYKYYKRFVNFKNPVTMDEKLMTLSLEYYKDPLISLCSDKYSVRKFVEENYGHDILNELIAVYDSIEEFNWDEVPDKCAIKCTHGCGYNIIIKNKSKACREEIIRKLEVWMKDNYAYHHSEKHYDKIVPRIIVEKYLEKNGGGAPTDYKFFVTKGKVIGCMIALGRGEKLERLFVDNEFNDTHFIQEYTGNDYKKIKPHSWDEMLYVASKLGEKFPFVRVDLYDVDGKIVFGELTFTPNSCLHNHFTAEGQLWIGEKIDL